MDFIFANTIDSVVQSFENQANFLKISQIYIMDA